jgi:hypothetical protein
MNRGHAAICDQLRAAEDPIVTDQIWGGMIASGLGRKTYQLSEGMS